MDLEYIYIYTYLLYQSLGEGCPNGKFSEERCVCVRARGLCDGEAADAPWANPGLGVYCCSCPDLGRFCLGFVLVLSRLSRFCLGFVSVLSRCCLGVVPVLSRCCLGVVSVLSRCCLGVVSVLSRFVSVLSPVETHGGNTLWKHTVETHCGNTLWKHTVETHCGYTLWKTHCGKHIGNTLWKHTVGTHCGHPPSPTNSLSPNGWRYRYLHPLLYIYTDRIDISMYLLYSTDDKNIF